jgi:acylglycerol lipase
MQFDESYIETRTHQLFVRCRKPADRPKALVLLTHGVGEHSGRYTHVAEYLSERGYEFCAYDLRGHGRSGGRRGHIDRYDELLDDLEAVLNHVRITSVPVFLYGHSLGGQIVLNFLLKRQPDVSGAIVASPWLRLAFKPHLLKLFLAKALLKIWPTFTQITSKDLTRLSRDQEFILSMKDLDLVHRKMSARMFYELTLAASEAFEGAGRIKTPLLLIHGGDDIVTSCAATKEFYDQIESPDKTLRIYPGMLHETHNELERESVLNDVAAWIEQRSAVSANRQL